MLAERVLYLAGDALIGRRWPQAGTSALGALVGSTDGGLCNIETLFHRYECFPMPAAGALNLQSDPGVAETLRDLNVVFANLANNHAGDFGPASMLASRNIVRELGISTTGAGASLEDARRPACGSGSLTNVTVIGVVTTTDRHAVATDASGSIRARPGVRSLRFATLVPVAPAAFSSMTHLLHGIARVDPERRTMSLPPVTFVEAAGEGPPTSVPHPIDLARLLADVSEARQHADLVVLTIHSHEVRPDGKPPADFLRTTARRAIRAGASVVACHGHHAVNGIEVYEGKPIFYGLGSFFFEYQHAALPTPESLDDFGLPASASLSEFLEAREAIGAADFTSGPEYWEGLLPVLHFAGDILRAVELYPLDLWGDGTMEDRGRPRLATEERAAALLERLRRESDEFDTRIDGEGIGELVFNPR